MKTILSSIFFKCAGDESDTESWLLFATLRSHTQSGEVTRNEGPGHLAFPADETRGALAWR